MTRFRHALRLPIILLLALVFIQAPANADPSDIDAAGRGVVRVMIIGQQDGSMYPVSHGTGFAVTPERIVTNAHVVKEARDDDTLSIAIVPSDGGKVVYGKIAAFSERNDLALVETTSPLNLPPLTIAGSEMTDSSPVTAVGYPMNVDRAQGLTLQDIFNATPPVKSRGFLSGQRPSREFDTILHTAPIGKGSSGGPLLDNCGRVIGVNSFGAESDGSDSEFYFAVSNRELLPFLRANGIVAQVNSLPCRSLADLDAQERARAERDQMVAMQQQESKATRDAERAEKARREAEFSIIAEREDAMMLCMLLVLSAIGGGYIVHLERERGEIAKMKVAVAATGIAVIAAAATWALRPDFGEVEDRVAQVLAAEDEAARGKTGEIEIPAATPSAGKFVCSVDVERSRITSMATDDVPFSWTAGGCVNGRTQYGLHDSKWSRVLVPNDEASVSVNAYDPDTHEYRVERYLLPHDAMEAVREARARYELPECGTGNGAANTLGSNQAAIFTLLPAQPNERLVYNCHAEK
ncbi:MAG: serine protease [Candidatus Andeanibacterium colombiense]|uniref:Serine protease n=1 Tax=Candidatus Andeanibacterium colombiense TaxID=3121345 RepID=A0AAJ5X8P6_9SPHN|nr:MAG: serine protease [Sphingomonadaceae bacterium]